MISARVKWALGYSIFLGDHVLMHTAPYNLVPPQIPSLVFPASWIGWKVV